MCPSGYPVTDIAQPLGVGGGSPPGSSAFLQSWTSGTKVSSSQVGAEVRWALHKASASSRMQAEHYKGSQATQQSFAVMHGSVPLTAIHHRRLGFTVGLTAEVKSQKQGSGGLPALDGTAGFTKDSGGAGGNCGARDQSPAEGFQREAGPCCWGHRDRRGRGGAQDRRIAVHRRWPAALWSSVLSGAITAQLACGLLRLAAAGHRPLRVCPGVWGTSSRVWGGGGEGGLGGNFRSASLLC